MEAHSGKELLTPLHLNRVLPSLRRSPVEEKAAKGGDENRRSDPMLASDRDNVSTSVAWKALLQRLGPIWRENYSAVVVAAGMMLLFVLTR